MYLLYLDNVMFPVAPGKIETEVEFDNKTYSLVDGSRVCQLGGKGLRRFSFELLLPMTQYPFAQYDNGFCDAQYYTDVLNRIAAKNQPVCFDLYKSYIGREGAYLTSVYVVPEKIVICEDAENGYDVTASVVLREYRNVETKIAEERVSAYESRENNYELPETYTVKAGDSLWLISKKVFGDGAKYTYLAEINGINKPYVIYTGQVIRLRE